MKEERRYTIELNEIKFQIYQIKILLIIIIALCVLGFSGLSRSTAGYTGGIISAIFKLLLVAAVIAIPIILSAWIASIFSISKMNPKIDKQLQNIIEKAESEQQQKN